MPRLIENTIMVLLTFMVTAAAVFVVVENAPLPSTADIDTLQTCPATGCASYGCHAAGRDSGAVSRGAASTSGAFGS